MKKIIGYNVYHAADGGAAEYYGFAATLDEAKELAARGRALQASLWDTARTAGHCDGLAAPDQTGEDDEVAEWFGADGYDCAVAVWR